MLRTNIYLTEYPQITFQKDVYRRHVEFYKTTTEFDFIGNHAEIFYETDVNSSIKQIVVNNVKNIKHLTLFIVGKNIDLNSLTPFTDTVCNEIPLFPNNNELNIDNHLTNIFIIASLSNKALKTNAIIYNHKSHKIDETKYGIIPICNNFLYLKMLKENYKMVMVIEKYDESIVNHKIIVTANFTNSHDEQRRFNDAAHECLIKRYQTKKYNLQVGENVIPFDFTAHALSHMFVNSDNPININYQIKIDNKIVPENPIILNSTMKNSNDDLLFFSYRTTAFNTYYYDAGENIKGQHQPIGHTIINDECKFIIDSTIDCEIDITYVLFDIVRYISNEFVIASDISRFTPLSPTEIVTVVPHDPIAQINANHEQTPVERVIPALIQIPEPNKKEINIYAMMSYNELFLKFIKEYEISTSICKKLSNDNNECAIDQAEISIDGFYYICPQCNKPFEKENLLNWSIKKHGELSCPCCRFEFDSLPQIFINKEEDNNNTFDTAKTGYQISYKEYGLIFIAIGLVALLFWNLQN